MCSSDLTAQFGVEAMFLPIAETTAPGEISVEDLRQLLMPEKNDRRWFRLMTGLASTSEADESIRQWTREFDARMLEKLKTGFALVSVPISQDHVNCLHATFIGALQLDAVDPSDESFERLSRAVATALDVVLPRTQTPSTTESLVHVPIDDESALRRIARGVRGDCDSRGARG